jgi:excisionase family DNA binding protein
MKQQQYQPIKRLAYALPEACQLLGGIPLLTLRAFVKERRIKAFKTGRKYMITHDEITRYIERQTRELEHELVGKKRRGRG